MLDFRRLVSQNFVNIYKLSSSLFHFNILPIELRKLHSPTVDFLRGFLCFNAAAVPVRRWVPESHIYFFVFLLVGF